MKFHHPSRPKLPNGVPCWISAPAVALPRIYVKPWPLSVTRLIYTDQSYDRVPFERELVEIPRFSLELMIDGAPKIIVQTLDTISTILSEWHADPELTLTKWWHLNAPSEVTATAPGTETANQTAPEGLTPEDLF